MENNKIDEHLKSIDNTIVILGVVLFVLVISAIVFISNYLENQL